jgi:hypothetical protein
MLYVCECLSLFRSILDFFTALDSGGFRRLFSYSETDLTVTQVTRLRTANDDGVTHLTALGDTLYFVASDSGSTNQKIYRYTPTQNLVEKIVDRNGGASDQVFGMWAMSDRIVYIGHDTSAKYRLFEFLPGD